MKSSWFFLSTLNYDARSTTHQIYLSLMLACLITNDKLTSTLIQLIDDYNGSWWCRLFSLLKFGKLLMYKVYWNAPRNATMCSTSWGKRPEKSWLEHQRTNICKWLCRSRQNMSKCVIVSLTTLRINTKLVLLFNDVVLCLNINAIYHEWRVLDTLMRGSNLTRNK